MAIVYHDKKRSTNIIVFLKQMFLSYSFYGILFILFSMIIIYLNFVKYFTFLAVIISPIITILLISIKEGYNTKKYNLKLKAALIIEIGSNLDIISRNLSVLNKEQNYPSNHINAVPLSPFVLDAWDILKYNYSQSFDFDIILMNNYVHGLSTLSESFNDRNRASNSEARKTYNDTCIKLITQVVDIIHNSLKYLNTELLIFDKETPIDDIMNILEAKKVYILKKSIEHEIKGLSEQITIIINKN